MTIATYATVKASLVTAGLPTSAGAGWNSIDEGSYTTWCLQLQLAKGAIDPIKANYGFAYSGEMPPQITAGATPPYSATLAASPSSGTAVPLSVTLTLTETGGAGTSFAWNFGDGATATTTVNHTTHSYTVLGNYTPTVVPTVGGVAQPVVTGAVISIQTP